MKRKWIIVVVVVLVVACIAGALYLSNSDKSAENVAVAENTTSSEEVKVEAAEVQEGSDVESVAAVVVDENKIAPAVAEESEPDIVAEPETVVSDAREGEMGGWLEMPALRTDGAYAKAEEITITSGGERNYTLYYDFSAPTVMWVAYPLEARHMGTMKRPARWSYNPLIDTKHQINLCSHSYNDSYARGHLIPNASRNGNLEMQQQTFYVTNSVPQIQNKFNGGIWQRLEDALQDEAANEKLYIVTGVAFSKVGEQANVAYTTAKDDARKVPIPNYFYKVVLKVNTDNAGVVTSASTVGFWFDHRTYTDTYDNYTVSVDQIEAWTGFDYFCNLPDAIESAVETNTSWANFKNF